MLPLRFDANGWGLCLELASFQHARLTVALSDGEVVDLLAQADEPEVIQLGEGERISRTFAIRDHFIGQVRWTVQDSAITLQVRLKAERTLRLDRLTFIDAPLEELWLDGEPATQQLLAQPADLGLKSTPGVYRLGDTPAKGTLATLLANERAALTLGQVGEPRHFVSFETADERLRVWTRLDGLTLQPGQELHSEQLWLTADASPLAAIERYGEHFGPPGRYTAAGVSGWNSWDYYLQCINQEMVLENVDAIEARPWLSDAARAIVIDDGWQNSRGDWRPGSHFNLPAFVARCQQANRLPGIWLAPFCVDTHSPLVRQRPELLCRYADETPQMGLRWYILDASLPEAEQMIRQWFRDLYTIGFRYFKVDFIFVLFLAQRLANGDQPRLERVRHLLRAIREEVGDSYLLGCSAPPEAVMGICDGNRLGADISADWSAFVHAASTVGAKYWMHNRLYVSDADFVVVRSPATSDDAWREHPNLLSSQASGQALADISPLRPMASPRPVPLAQQRDFMGRQRRPLTQPGETRCWATLSLLAGGPLTLSDRLSQLNAEGWAQLETVFGLFTGEAARPLDLMRATPPSIWARSGDAPLLALFNWSDAPQEVSVAVDQLPLALRGRLCDVWHEAERSPAQGLVRCQLPPRDVALLLPFGR